MIMDPVASVIKYWENKISLMENSIHLDDLCVLHGQIERWEYKILNLYQTDAFMFLL